MKQTNGPKTVLRSIAAAFSMFSRIPMPQFPWDEATLAYLLCGFPLVGLVIGGLVLGWLVLCAAWGWSGLFRAAGVALLPLAISGGVHMDGFCDVQDALACHGTAEQRRAILKDPHSGAFALIGLGMYLLAYTACASELPLRGPALFSLALSFGFSRSLSGFVSLAYPRNPGEGLLHTFRQGAKKKRALVLLGLWALALAAGMVACRPLTGAGMLLAALAALGGLLWLAKKRFDGVSGDLSGWFLQTAELAMLAALILLEKAVTL